MSSLSALAVAKKRPARAEASWNACVESVGETAACFGDGKQWRYATAPAKESRSEAQP
jgi:hypothetical protein